MPRSTESIMAELDARKIGYKTDMGNSELQELLDCAKAAQKAKEDTESRKEKTDAETVDLDIEAVEPEKPVDMTGIRCGLGTIQGLHTRITILERKFEVLEQTVKDA